MEVLLRLLLRLLLLLLLMVVSRKGRVGMIRHLLLLLLLLLRLVVLLVELGLHVVVPGFDLETLEMLPVGPVMLLVVVELLRGGRRDSSVLAHDAAAGGLCLVEEGGHHDGEVAEKPDCVCCVWGWVSGRPLWCMCWRQSSGISIWMRRCSGSLSFSLGCVDEQDPRGRDVDGQERVSPV